jgi:hypothetical protein
MSNAKPQIKIYDCATGETTERDFNANELEQQQKDEIARQTTQSQIQAKAAAKSSALAKLAALGLSADEIAAL